MGCFSGCPMSSAGTQKLSCGIYSTFKCSFDEFVGEKVFSPSYSSAILAPPSKATLCYLGSNPGSELATCVPLESYETLPGLSFLICKRRIIIKSISQSSKTLFSAQKLPQSRCPVGTQGTIVLADHRQPNLQSPPGCRDRTACPIP